MIVPWSAHFTEILDWIGLPAAVVVFDVVDGVVVEVVVGLVVVVVDVVWVVPVPPGRWVCVGSLPTGHLPPGEVSPLAGGQNPITPQS